MEKPTEPNKSNLEEGLNKSSDNNTNSSEKKQASKSEAVPETVKKEINFDSTKFQ